MKFDVEDDFVADYRRLTHAERALFRNAIRQINEAYDQRGDRAIPHWPASLRIKRVWDIHHRIWEMTWSFAGPDGRATFELISVDDELVLKWRRVGDHRIFDRP